LTLLRRPAIHVAHDVRVRDLGEEAGLVLEPLDLAWIVPVQHLDRDVLPGRPVQRPVNRPHPARARKALDREATPDDVSRAHPASTYQTGPLNGTPRREAGALRRGRRAAGITG